MAGGPWDTEKDLRQIANLGLLEFMSQLARQGKEDDDPNPTVRNRQLPSRDVEVGPFIGPACGASPPGKKILKGEYVDMAELLKDNMEVERHLQESEMGHASRVAIRREIPDLLSAIACMQLSFVLSTWRKPGNCGLIKPPSLERQRSVVGGAGIFMMLPFGNKWYRCRIPTSQS